MSPTSAQNISVRRAVNPSDEEVAKATAVLYKAFGDIWFDALGEDRALVSEYLGAYLKAGLVGGDDGGHVYFAENEDKEIVGVTVWFPPGQTAMGTLLLARGGMESINEQVEAGVPGMMLRLVYDDFVASESVLGPVVFVGAFHLQLIGIHPDYQRQGVAKKMMGIVEDEADRQKTICVLEASDEEHPPPNSLPWLGQATGIYKALGYKIRGIKPGIPDVKGNPTICFYSLSKGHGTVGDRAMTLVLSLNLLSMVGGKTETNIPAPTDTPGVQRGQQTLQKGQENEMRGKSLINGLNGQ
ncbi:hypothetical protein DFH06DRAFT_1309604 [Mycena polygramma]|nr:hypothetical protein DFH06DRAFT_1309604 [Mycena polygramma]